jgi:hypothetical protein
MKAASGSASNSPTSAGVSCGVCFVRMTVLPPNIARLRASLASLPGVADRSCSVSRRISPGGDEVSANRAAMVLAVSATCPASVPCTSHASVRAAPDFK